MPSDSDRPVDLLVASLVASTSAGEAETPRQSMDAVPPEEADRVGRAVEAMAKGAEPGREVVRSVPGPASRSRRLDHFCDALARFFDFDEARARQLLARIDMPEEWMDGPAPGITVLPVETGPGVAQALASLVRLPAGVTLSAHPHLGREQLFVLEGGFADSEGHVVWPGETLEMAAGTAHSMWGLPGPACVCAALVWVEGGDEGA